IRIAPQTCKGYSDDGSANGPITHHPARLSADAQAEPPSPSRGEGRHPAIPRDHIPRGRRHPHDHLAHANPKTCLSREGGNPEFYKFSGCPLLRARQLYVSTQSEIALDLMRNVVPP